MTATLDPPAHQDTLKANPPARGKTGGQEACLIHIYPTGPLLGRRYPVGDGPVVIGRNDDCRVQNVDGSVSRHHARIESHDGLFLVTDLGSTNGTFVNNAACATAPLADGDYLRVGNCIYRFLAGGNLEAEYHEEIYRLTILDGLTGVPNRRHFEEFLDREVVRAVRHGRGLVVAMIDIDHFKQVNDRFGHLAGDLVLRRVAAAAAAGVRRDELFARYGGEEFALVLPETDAAQAAAVCERVRAAVAGLEFVFGSQRCPVTVSVGVAVLAGDGTAADLVRAADAELYRAKSSGRDRVCVAAGPCRPSPTSRRLAKQPAAAHG